MKKIINISVVAIVLGGLWLSPVKAQVDNSAFIAQLKAQIAALMAQIQALQSQQGNAAWCHTFATDIKVADQGSEVSALWTALGREGLSVNEYQGEGGPVFGESTAAGVVNFQQKYGIRATGYVGPLTRGKLNQLYGCSGRPTPPVPGNLSIVSPIGGSYKVGDTIHISWTPINPGVQEIALVPTDNSNPGYFVYSAKVNNDPVITNGFYDYTVQKGFVPSGSYYVRIGYAGYSPSWIATSNSPIRITNTVTLFFGNTAGQNNSVTISPGSSQTLKWDSTSATNCSASASPYTSYWSGSVPLSGTKKINNINVSETYYLTCGNSLNSVSSAFAVNVYGSSAGAPVINYFNVSNDQKVAVSGSNFSKITLKAQCPAGVDPVVGGQLIDRSQSVCNTEKLLYNYPGNDVVDTHTNNMEQFQNIIFLGDQGVATFTNGSGSNVYVPITLTACNTQGACVQRTANMLVYAKG